MKGNRLTTSERYIRYLNLKTFLQNVSYDKNMPKVENLNIPIKFSLQFRRIGTFFVGMIKEFIKEVVKFVYIKDSTQALFYKYS